MVNICMLDVSDEDEFEITDNEEESVDVPGTKKSKNPILPLEAFDDDYFDTVESLDEAGEDSDEDDDADDGILRTNTKARVPLILLI